MSPRGTRLLGLPRSIGHRDTHTGTQPRWPHDALGVVRTGLDTYSLPDPSSFGGTQSCRKDIKTDENKCQVFGCPLNTEYLKSLATAYPDLHHYHKFPTTIAFVEHRIPMPDVSWVNVPFEHQRSLEKSTTTSIDCKYGQRSGVLLVSPSSGQTWDHP